jgi:hypothetical protein
MNTYRGSGVNAKRRRRNPPMYYDPATASEQRLLQQAIQNAKLDRNGGTPRPADGKLHVPPGPVFFPTIEEFVEGPVAYVEKIRSVAEKYGICKVVPPPGWNPECRKLISWYVRLSASLSHRIMI